jgi:acetyltransferase-like isoleucine patch superfamily enzyme
MSLRVISRVFLFYRRLWRGAKILLLRSAFHSHGTNLRFDPDGVYTFDTIDIGNDVYIGPAPVFIAVESKIIIGNKVLFGPRVSIVGGNHNTHVVGKFMFDVKEKAPEDDKNVVIEDDVWVGLGAVILKGVRLGRGSIVAAGAVVTKSVPSYAIVAGMPGRVIDHRFSKEAIMLHESKLYPPEQRLSEQTIVNILRSL